MAVTTNIVQKGQPNMVACGSVPLSWPPLIYLELDVDPRRDLHRLG